MASNSNTNETTEHRSSQIAIGKGASWVFPGRTEEQMKRVGTGQRSMDESEILSERLRWLGHVIRMDHLDWEDPGFKRGPGHAHINWRSTVNKDLLKMGITWEEAEVTALNRSEWHQSEAQNRPMHPLGYGLNQGQGQRFQCQ